MLTPDIIKKINKFVYSKPRTIDEISKHIKKNWRTANRYVDKIAEEQGTLCVRVFRGGTRGALKIVYYANIETINSSSFQERLFNRIESHSRQEEFSPSEIFQHIPDNKKTLFILNEEDYYAKDNFKNFIKYLEGTQKQLLIFSGNLSFLDLKSKNESVLQILERLAKKGVSIKILTRVDFPGMKNLQKIVSLNNKHGKELIEARQCFQPLRCTVIDNKLFRLKQELKKLRYKELEEDRYLLYEVRDKEWIEWIQRIFWNLFNKSVSIEKSIKDLEKIKSIKKQKELML